MRDMLPALFQLATGLGFLLFLATAYFAGPVKATVWGRLILVALIFVPLGFLMMSQGVGQSTLGRAAPMLAVGGAAFLIAAGFASAGLFVLARDLKAKDRMA